ncbi:MAG: nucleotide pyrophosphatase [Acidobacteria bacterium]|nr:nucleotide pyrophosphatase [Acidobacteriota bacterium]
MRSHRWAPLAALALALALPGFAEAYVGPGAGFAFVGSFVSLLVAFAVGFASLLIWPFRVAMRALRGSQGYKKAKVKKVIFLGLDGLEPTLVEKYLAEGKMPNLAKLRDEGQYSTLRTTFPALSPVAWSTFATGSNPGKHQMFDFLNRSFKSYIPELASSHVAPPTKMLKLGKWRIPLGKPIVELRRKSKTFWSILGDNHVATTILRVPITFPPEKFEGKLLSAMCTPDLLGTQGSFQEFTTKTGDTDFEAGFRFPLRKNGRGYDGDIVGPDNSLVEGGGAMKIPFKLVPNGSPGHAVLELPDEKVELHAGKNSDWVRLTFKAGPGVKVTGITQFRIVSTEPEVSLYCTPISIDPEAPALPISHPSYYATYLAKLLGDYSTLGFAEDTWALNERVIDEDAFLEQAYSVCDEREKMFFSTLEKTKRGMVTCVFDTSDRVQHMFFRYLESDHPAHKANGNGLVKYQTAIEDLYKRMDDIVGRTFQYVDDETVLFVLSDHGFKSFQRGVQLNTWLLENGYLAVKEGADLKTMSYLRAVDWSKTRAYSFGLAGIYLNVKGREAEGIVEPKEAPALMQEIADKLTGLIDEERNAVAISRAYPKSVCYSGPYMRVAPDVVVGYSIGYRSAWDVAVGKVGAPVFEDNLKAWSGDHCIDPPLIPGVLFANRKFKAERPGIEDMGPTCLSLFGFPTPAFMDGKDIQVEVAR